MPIAEFVSGYIFTRSLEDRAFNMEVISNYKYDVAYPFTNIFWGGSPAIYWYPLIGFTGSYPSIRGDWSEWLWKFGQLLSQLEAFEAEVSLHSLMGKHRWVLKPKITCIKQPKIVKHGRLIGQPWVISEWPEDDFSIDPEFLKLSGEPLYHTDPETGVVTEWKWDRFVERMKCEGY